MKILAKNVLDKLLIIKLGLTHMYEVESETGANRRSIPILILCISIGLSFLVEP